MSSAEGSESESILDLEEAAIGLRPGEVILPEYLRTPDVSKVFDHTGQQPTGVSEPKLKTEPQPQSQQSTSTSEPNEPDEPE